MRRKRHRFDPWVGKIPWRTAWQPIPVFLLGESHGQRRLGGYSPKGHKDSDMTEATSRAHHGRVYHAKCWAGWITNWNQDCREKYQQPQICRWYHSNDRKWRETKEPLDEVEKASLKLNIQKTNIMASGPITSWQRKGEKVKAVTDFIFLAPKSLQTVTAPLKLKGTCSSEGKLWRTWAVC